MTNPRDEYLHVNCRPGHYIWCCSQETLNQVNLLVLQVPNFSEQAECSGILSAVQWAARQG
ncbi:hypothetical protein FRX31_013817 [Thalictrum thalictroides]|uniref:Uncharacterized protein n=1 Tax=Thalictrum thalictroides TaxID=46969 RepID=A0A7J6WJF3_THATH|nr:hypothetical protein FRX31_013817 [Thalictrum thalictroides]